MRNNIINSAIKVLKDGRWTATFVGVGVALGVAIDLTSGMVLIGLALTTLYGLWIGAGIDSAISGERSQATNNFHALA